MSWSWQPECQEAFESARELLQSAKVLAHYDVNLPIKLACDASSYGIGAVLSHVMPGGEEHPVAFTSRTLSASEKNYAQLEKCTIHHLLCTMHHLRSEKISSLPVWKEIYLGN